MERCKMKYIIYMLMLLLMVICSIVYPQKSEKSNYPVSPDGDPIRAYLNLNNISTKFKNNGISDIDIYESNSGFVFPKGTWKTAVYESGLIWGAILNRPGEEDPHVGGSTYRSGLQGGKIISPGIAEDPNLPHVRIYRVRPDVYPGGPWIDLSVESFDEGKTEIEIRTQYELDWTEWRAIDGAPFNDVDANGFYDPNIDVPGVPGAAQTIWFVANDLDASLTYFLYGTAPMGVEYQATYWEYSNGSFLDNLFFRKYKLINKSTLPFNDMYISMWSDPDVGTSTDDFVGCDTTLNMVYAYNADELDQVYDPYPPPAIGFDLLKGPTVQGNQNLLMVAAYYFLRSDPALTDPALGSYTDGAVRFYRFMQGLIGLTGEPFINPETGLPTTYALSGDPLTGEGWIDGEPYGPGDRRVGLASGPFNMAVGGTQEVVVAEIAAIGLDRLQAYRILKYYDALAQEAYDNGLEINSSTPPRTQTPNTSVIGTTWKINLNWGLDSASVSSIENFNQKGYSFQGYNVYQLDSPLPIKENAVRFATYDKVDGITEIEGIVMDPVTGLPVNGIQQYGSDSGIERMILTNYDYIEDSYMRVGKKYYFAVTAYTYNSDPLANPNNSESLLEVIEATFYDSLGGASYGDSILVTHSQGIGDGNVNVVVDDPTQLTGNDYEVFFNQQTYFRNENGEWVPIPPGRPTGTDTLTWSTIDIGAVYGPSAGVIELACHLNLVSPDFNWADGISMTFPPGITVIEAPPFEAGGGMVYPEIVGNTLNLGLVNGPPTGNGIFHGDEDWTVLISSFQPPLSIDWIIYDDGYSGGTLNAQGSTVIVEIGYAFKTEDHWNLFNLTTQDTVLEDQTVIMGFDLYTGEYVGDPVVEGFKISVDANYDSVSTIGSVEVNGTTLNYSSNNVWWLDDNFIVCDFTKFGTSDGTAATTLPLYGGAGGTLDPIILQQDLEFRWTGMLADIVINGDTITITQSGGSIATLFGASAYSLADHPLNPNPGIDEPFTVRVPFEIWNVDENQKVNIVFWDRSGNPTVSGGAVWNQTNRVYTWIVNTPYSPNLIDVTSQLVEDNATWNVIYYLSTFTLNDITKVIYFGPITSDDKFTFTTPEGVVSVEDESLPTRFQVFQNYPNPFNPTTKIRFTLPQQALVKLEVYDILGQRIAQLVNTELTAGTHEVLFNASNHASGIYFYVLNVKDKLFEAKKMILLK
jgi:hypothetical protein